MIDINVVRITLYMKVILQLHSGFLSLLPEKALNETVCPQSVKMETMNSGKECVFAFKRKASNIAWPRKLQTT